MEPHLNDMIQYGFYALIGFLGMRASHQFETVSTQMSALVSSIQELNKAVAIVVERSQWHDKLLDKHDDRITRVEGMAKINMQARINGILDDEKTHNK